MFIYGKRRANPQKIRTGSPGFPDGWNSLPHPSALKDTELAELINGIYSQYGSVSKRKGCKIMGNLPEGATRVINARMFYKIGGEDYMLRLTDLGTVERFNFSTEVWSLLTGTVPAGYSDSDPTFTSDSPVFTVVDGDNNPVFINMVQANGKIYFAGPMDRLVMFDGTDWKIFQELADPASRPTVVKTGAGTGTRSYYWRYADLNDFGTSLSSPANDGGQSSGAGFLDNMPVIDGENFATVTIPAAAAGTTRRALYRGDVAGQEFFIASLETSQTVYVDKNNDTPDHAFAVPSENTTGGYHFYLLEVYADSLVGTTVELGKDMLVWSAGAGIGITLNDPFTEGTFESFALADGAGFDDYHRGDGQNINAIQPFSVANSDGLAVFKDARTGLLVFDSQGGGNIQNVNVIRGTMSPLSPHVAGNNVRFYSSEGVASIGHEQNYGTILRYTVMSLKADALTKRVTPANLPKVCSQYYQNLSLFGISTGTASEGNNTILVYDERYNTWAQWTGLYPSVFFKGIHPTTKIEELYFGDSKSGAVVKMFTGKTDYETSSGSGTKITLSVTTKQYDAKLPDKFKKYDKVVFVFGSLFGNGTTAQAIYMGDAGIKQFPRLRVSTDPTFSGFGNDEWGDQEIGMMTEGDTTETFLLRYINLRQTDMFWVKINLQNDGIEDDMTLIGVYFYYTLSERELPSRSNLTVLA